MSAVIAFGAARRGAERRVQHEAEHKAHQKAVADAERALRSLHAATTLEELSDVGRAMPRPW